SGSAVQDAVFEKIEKLSSVRYRYHFKDSNTQNSTRAFTDGTLSLQFSAGSWGTTLGNQAPGAMLSATVRQGKATGNSGTSASAGPIGLSGPRVWIEDVQFYVKPTTDLIPHTAVAIVTVGVGADSASLNLGSGSSQSDSGLTIELKDIIATFDINVELNIDRLLNRPGHESEARISAGLSGSFGIDVGSLSVALSDIFKASATGIRVTWDPLKDKDYDGVVSEAEQTAWEKSEILSINSAEVNITKVGAKANLDPYTRDDGTIIKGLSLRNNGLTLGSASITKTGPFDFGNVLQLGDITAGIQNFDITYGETTSFTGNIFLASTSASLFPGKAFSATITDGSDADTEAVRATLTFTEGTFDGFRFQADEFSFTFGTLVSVFGKQIVIDTSATDADEVVAFESIGAKITAGSLRVGGEMRNFAILGDGSFKTKTGFGVFVSLDTADPNGFQWPAWLPIKITEFGVTWDDINAHPDDFSLIISGGITGLQDLPLTVSGAVSRVVISPKLLVEGKFPITGIDAIAVSVSGQMFGGDVVGTLLGGILEVDAKGDRIPAGNSSTPVADRVFFVGLEGGYTMPGLGGMKIRLAFSDLGPLGVQITAASPLGIMIDPATGLTLNDFVGGVEFFKSLPSIREPEELRNSAFSISSHADPTLWLTSTQDQVIAQYRTIKTNPNQAGYAAAFTAPMLITGGAKIYSQYGSQYSINGDVQFKIDTAGRMLLGGKLYFFAGLLTTSAKLYLDLSQVADGGARILFLSDVPDQAPMLIAKGKLEMAYLDGDGNSVTPGDSSTEKPTAVTIFPTPDGSVGVQQMAKQNYIDVGFDVPDGQQLDLATISDAAVELKLVAPDGTVTSVTATPTQPEGFAARHEFRYALPTDMAFTPGEWTVRFIARSFADKSGNLNALKTNQFTVATPSAAMAVPANAGSVDRVVLNSTLQTLQVRFLPVPGQTLDVATITDTAAEFTLAGAAAAGITLGTPTKSATDDLLFTYPFSGSFGAGEVTVNFTADSFTDTAGNKNAASTATFTVNAATAALTEPAVDVAELNQRKYIDIQFRPTSGATLTDSSISDVEPEFTLSGTAASGVTLATVPTSQGKGVWRYSFAGSFVPGTVTLTFTAGSFTDSAGNASLLQTTAFNVVGAIAAAENPASGTYTSLQALNNRQWFDIRLTGVAGSSVTPESVSDEAAEFTITGPGKGTAVVSSVEKIDGDTWRYHFTGAFVEGQVTLQFQANTFNDANNLPNIASTQFWTATDPKPGLANPKPDSRVSSSALNASHKLSVTFPDTFGKGLLAASITDAESEFTIRTRDANGNLQDIPGVSVDGAGVAVAGEVNTWEFSYSGSLPDSGVVIISYLAGAWTDIDGNAGGAGSEEFRTFHQGSGLEIKIAGSLEYRLPFVVNGVSSIYTVNGNAVFRSTADRVTLDFDGSASMIYLGTIGATAGRFVMLTSIDEGFQFWGVARIDLNLEKLQPLGIDADLFALLVINTSSSAKTETITLKGQAKDGSDLIDTYKLQPLLFGIEAAGDLSLHVGTGLAGKPTGAELGKFSGAVSMEVSATGLTAFLKGDLQLGPADARLLQVSTTGVLSITDDGLALDVQVGAEVGATGPLKDIFSFDVNGRLVLNTTSKEVEVGISNNLLEYLPDEYVASLPQSSSDPTRKAAKIPAGPPRKNNTYGDAVPYLVATLDGELVIGGVYTIEGSTRFEIISTAMSVDISGFLDFAPIAGVAIDGSLQIRNNGVDDFGVVGALQLAAGLTFGPVQLTAFAQVEMNSTATSASIDRHTFDYDTNSVSDETVTATLPAGTRRIFLDGNATIQNMVRFSGTYETLTERTTDSLTTIAYADGTMKLGPTGQDVLKLDVTGLFYWHNEDFAFRVSGDAGVNAVGLTIDATLDVSMNTSSRDITYDVPEPAKTRSGRSTFTITAGPPLLGGGSGPAASYVVAMGTGTLGILDLLELDGEFRFEISTTKVDVFVGATMDFDPFGSAGVSGNFQLGVNGAAGSLSMAFSGGISAVGVSMSGVFALDFNTGSSIATVRTINVDSETGTVSGFKNEELPAQSARVMFGGSMIIADSTTLDGSIELGQFSGAVSMEVSTTGLTAFLHGNMKMGPADARLLQVSTTGVVSITDDGLALDAKIAMPVDVTGPLKDIVNFKVNVSGRLVLNTTSKEVEVRISDNLLEYLSDDYVASLPQSSSDPTRKAAKIPAGPPRKNDTHGDAVPYLVATLNGELVIGGVYTIEGSTRLEATPSSTYVDISGLLNVGPIVDVVIAGSLQIHNAVNDNGVVGALQLAAGLHFGPVQLTAFAQIEINSTATPALIDRYTFDYDTNTVSQKTVTAALPAGTRRMFLDGNATIQNMVRFSGTFETLTEVTTDGLTTIAYADGTMKLGPTGQDVLKLDVTGLFYWHN
ncbi:MAG: hypothetical protein WCK86_15650, partial [Planctomycetia bacterium]